VVLAVNVHHRFNGLFFPLYPWVLACHGVPSALTRK
jgi:hypothetical protein